MNEIDPQTVAQVAWCFEAIGEKRNDALGFSQETAGFRRYLDALHAELTST